jgi:hypothetical protein
MRGVLCAQREAGRGTERPRDVRGKGVVTGDVTPRPRRDRRIQVLEGTGHEVGDERERSEQQAARLQIIDYRFAAAIALASAIALVPAFGPYRLYIAAFCAVAGTVANQVLRRQVLAGHPLPWRMPVIDVCTVLAVIVLAPSSYAVAVTVIVSMTGLFVFWFGGRFTLALLPVTGVALLGLGLWFEPPLWVPAFLAWTITSIISTAIFVRVASAHASSRNRYDELVNGIDAAVWEAPGPTGPPDYLSNHVTDLLGFTPAQLASSPRTWTPCWRAGGWWRGARTSRCTSASATPRAVSARSRTASR